MSGYLSQLCHDGGDHVSMGVLSTQDVQHGREWTQVTLHVCKECGCVYAVYGGSDDE